MISSNFDDCTTGRSAGLAPLSLKLTAYRLGHGRQCGASIKHQGEPVAVEIERRRRPGGGIGPELERGVHRAARRIEPHVEVNGLDQPVGRTVVGKADGAGFFGAHHVGAWLPIGRGQRSMPDRWAKSPCWIAGHGRHRIIA